MCFPDQHDQWLNIVLFPLIKNFCNTGAAASTTTVALREKPLLMNVLLTGKKD